MAEQFQLIPEIFYKSASTVVAPSLVGCVIVTHKAGIDTVAKITETEAYPSYDAASHAYGGKRTPRTEIQYSNGGRLYVYQIMGFHLMTSVVVGNQGIADVVFIRSVEPLNGIKEMRERRGYFGEDMRKLASGPGMLSVALAINKSENGLEVYSQFSAVRIYKDNTFKGEVETGLRINLGVHGRDVDEAQRSISQRWRYFEKYSSFLSK